MDKSTFCKQLPTEEYRLLPQVSFSDLRLASVYLGGSPQKYQYYKSLELARQEQEEEGITEPEQQKKAIVFGNAFHMFMADPEKVKILSAAGPDEESTQAGIFINTVAREERDSYIQKYKNLFPDDIDKYKKDFLMELEAGYYSKDNDVWKNSSSVVRAFNATQSKKYKVEHFLEELDKPENKAFFKALVTYNPETELLVTPEVRETLQRSIDNLKNHNFYKYLYNEGDKIELIGRTDKNENRIFDFCVSFRELQIVCKEIKGTIDNLRVRFTVTEQKGLEMVTFSISDYKTNYSSVPEYINSNKGQSDIVQLCFYQHLIKTFMLEQEQNPEETKHTFIYSLFESVKEEYLKNQYLKESDLAQQDISDFLAAISEIDAKPFLFVNFKSTIFHIQSSGKYNPVIPIRFVSGDQQERTIQSSLFEYSKMKEKKGDYSGFVIDYVLDGDYCETIYMDNLSEKPTEEKPDTDDAF